jgi:hypothetical protein
MTFLETKVVVRMVATHLRNPIEGVASGTRPLSTKDTSGISSARRNVAADSNQNKQVIWVEMSVSNLQNNPAAYQRTSAANSAMLPPLLFTDSGILKLEAITLLELFLVSNPKSLLALDLCL